MTRDKFKLIHSELIMQVQCIESDLKLIYAGMHSGDFEDNLDMLEKANLGTIIKKLKELITVTATLTFPNKTMLFWSRLGKFVIIGVINAI